MTALLLALAAVGTGVLWVANPDDQPIEMGPDVVILRELEKDYEPVPFDHLSHAKMAEMWNGCETCHHRSPHPAEDSDQATTATLTGERSQEASAEIPACKSCHPADVEEADIHMPGLKGAYHRQCLNCHKEWMHENACVICHEPKEGRAPSPGEPTPGDIVGRMHPPIPEPEAVTYKTRFTPADGGNVLFRHKEHTIYFGLKCVSCHHHDNCAHCHGPEGDTTALKPLKPGMTWDESHGPCMSCHTQDRCQYCHHKDDEPPPPAFVHAATGQDLDEDHIDLSCIECHPKLGAEVTLTCGDAACHKEGPIEYPAKLPGPLTDPAPKFADDDEFSTGTLLYSVEGF